MKRVTIEPVGKDALVNTGSTLLSALLAKDLRVLMSCGGKGICSTCHVHVCAGMDQLSPIGPKEQRTLALVADTTPESRLACQTLIYGDGVTVRVPEGMYIESADDLLELLGTIAKENILHPVTGIVLIPKGKLITRTLMEESRSLEQEVRRLREQGSVSESLQTSSTHASLFTASGVSIRPNLSGTTKFNAQRMVETKTHIKRSRAVPNTVSAPSTPPAPARPPAESSNFKSIGTNVQDDAAAVSKRMTSLAPNASPLVTGITPLNPPSKNPTGITAVRAGDQIDKYLLLECVGKGGAGVVYRALHTKLKTLVAIKFLRADLQADSSALERLTREAQLLAQLSHPNIVRVLDFEDHPTRPYVVMEFVDGLSAAELIKQSGRLSPTRALEVILDVASGLEAAYKIGVIHRDVKPGNILVTRENGSKLVDLGLAKVYRAGTDQGNGESLAGQAEGTVGYMSPEAAHGDPVDHRSDIYSLGATLFHLASGRLPYKGRVHEVILKHLREPPPDLLEVVPEAPQGLATLIQTMMAKDPSARFQDYKELRRELQAVLDDARTVCVGR